MVLNNTNKNNSILLEVLASVFTVSSNFPDNPRTCNPFDLFAFVGCWSSVIIWRIIYKFLNVCPFDCTAFVVSGNVGRRYL